MPPRPKKIVIPQKQIGEKLRSLRAQRGLSQTRLARILGTHQTNVSEMERGVRGITVQQLARLSTALGVSPNDILGMNGRSTTDYTQIPGRFLRRFKQVADLPRVEQQALLRIIDRMIEANHSRK